MTRRRVIAVLVLAVLILVGCQNPPGPIPVAARTTVPGTRSEGGTTLTVLVAASPTDAFKEIGRVFRTMSRPFSGNTDSPPANRWVG
jgi:ABC-type molybdate transport system substrate-binding protein